MFHGPSTLKEGKEWRESQREREGERDEREKKTDVISRLEFLGCADSACHVII